jgi:hypothetical protein
MVPHPEREGDKPDDEKKECEVEQAAITSPKDQPPDQRCSNCLHSDANSVLDDALSIGCAGYLTNRLSNVKASHSYVSTAPGDQAVDPACRVGTGAKIMEDVRHGRDAPRGRSR